jgi:hypothetical protein
MPVRTTEGIMIDVPLDKCVGRTCDDGRFHVILQDGTYGVWIRPEEIEDEYEEHRRVLNEWIPKNRKVRVSED